MEMLKKLSVASFPDSYRKHFLSENISLAGESDTVDDAVVVDLEEKEDKNNRGKEAQVKDNDEPAITEQIETQGEVEEVQDNDKVEDVQVKSIDEKTELKAESQDVQEGQKFEESQGYPKSNVTDSEETPLEADLEETQQKEKEEYLEPSHHNDVGKNIEMSHNSIASKIEDTFKSEEHLAGKQHARYIANILEDSLYLPRTNTKQPVGLQTIYQEQYQC